MSLLSLLSLLSPLSSLTRTSHFIVKLNLGQLFGGLTNNNNQENTNSPLWQILDNTAVRIGPGGIKVEVNQDSACPPLLGDPAPPGCDKTFADDGNIPCWDDTDCPNPGTCQNKLCNFWVPNDDCGEPGDPGCVELWDTFFQCKITEPDCAITAPDCKTPKSCISAGEIISFTRSECYNYLNKITDNSVSVL